MTSQALYLMLGFPGAGKTTAAREIAKLTGAKHIWADHERRQRFSQPTYTHQENIELYTWLNQKAEEFLKDGNSVVYDTNFNFFSDREKLRMLAEKHNTKTVVVWVITDKPTAQKRAVHDTPKDTRVLGNMPLEHWQRISDNLEQPRPSERVVKLDGTKITPGYVAEQLDLKA